jgi:hypothetical protein
LRLLLDEMFSPVIAAELRARGHDEVAIKEREEWQLLADPTSLLSHGLSAAPS